MSLLLTPDARIARATSDEDDAVEYPDSDGNPMADNTEQYQWIVTIQGGLDAQFAGDPNVLVVGDLLWYPVKGDNKTRTAPDVMVIFGRPKGYRGSYRQWEEGDIAPQVVWEIQSPGNRAGEYAAKRAFYDRYGVEEAYWYDPDRFTIDGYIRNPATGAMERIPDMNGWVSPRLGIRFEVTPGEPLRLYHPNGELFFSFVELAQDRELARQERDEAQEGREQAEQERDEAEQQRDRERERAERFAARLRELGYDPDAE